MPGADRPRSGEHDQQLATAVDNLTEQVHVLRDAIDEVQVHYPSELGL